MGLEAISDPAVRSLAGICAGVTFCDSTMLTVLVTRRNQGLAVDYPLSLRAAPRQMIRVLRLTGLDSVLDPTPLP